MEYVDDTEPAKIFHEWTALSIISAALQKKISLSLGRISVYPNIYVVLVADPGVARKSQAITFGHNLMVKVPNIIISADSTTPQALLDDIQTAAGPPDAVGTVLSDGRTLRHASMTIISKEFESFLGQKKENNKMLVMLTDLFDAQEIPYKYRTKHSGSNEIPSVYISMLAATTPDSLASSLPPTAIGGGLTSRMMFVWADKKAKKCPEPDKTPEVTKLEEDLVNDLHLIATMSGAYKFTPECRKKWHEWYHIYEDLDPKRLCKDPSFNGWYSRKPMYILKIAILVAASMGSRLEVRWEHIEKAMRYSLDIEKTMGLVFRAIGRSAITTDVDTLIRIVEQRKVIEERELMSMVWRDQDAAKFDNAMNTALRTGKVCRKFTGPDGKAGDTWYYEAEYAVLMERKLTIPKNPADLLDKIVDQTLTKKEI